MRDLTRRIARLEAKLAPAPGFRFVRVAGDEPVPVADGVPARCFVMRLRPAEDGDVRPERPEARELPVDNPLRPWLE